MSISMASIRFSDSTHSRGRLWAREGWVPLQKLSPEQKTFSCGM